MGWKVRGSNPGEGEIFRTRPDWPLGPPCLLYNGYPISSLSKAARAWRWPPTPSSAEVKETVELYPYSPSGLHGLLQGELYLYFTFYPVNHNKSSLPWKPHLIGLRITLFIAKARPAARQIKLHFQQLKTWLLSFEVGSTWSIMCTLLKYFYGTGITWMWCGLVFWRSGTLSTNCVLDYVHRRGLIIKL